VMDQAAATAGGRFLKATESATFVRELREGR
jgi:hypothetical protein